MGMEPLDPRARTILDFWFGPPGSDSYGAYRPSWFEVDPAFDAEVERRFLGDHEDAATGRLLALDAHPRGRLAHILLLDQVPRNVYRGTPRAFETDGMALAKAKAAVASGTDAALIPVERLFLYLPYQHSESLADQVQSVELYDALGNDDWLGFARQHYDIVARFGRFPHRNAVLGRETTPEEAEFLTQPGSSF